VFSGAPGVEKVLGVKFSGGKERWFATRRCCRLHFFTRGGSIQGLIPVIPADPGLELAQVAIAPCLGGSGAA